MQLRKKLHSTHYLVRDHFRMANDVGFLAADGMWFYNTQRRKGRNPKLQCQWEGPNVVLKRIKNGKREKKFSDEFFELLHKGKIAVNVAGKSLTALSALYRTYKNTLLNDLEKIGKMLQV